MDRNDLQAGSTARRYLYLRFEALIVPVSYINGNDEGTFIRMISSYYELISSELALTMFSLPSFHL